MGKPPLFAGGLNETSAVVLPKVENATGGASGTVAGITELDGADSGDLPSELVANTRNV
jgi:hypothetical protein